MKKILMIFLLSSLTLLSNQRTTILNAYKSKNYAKACRIGKKIYYNLPRAYSSLIADSCAKVDDINALGYLIQYMNKTRKDRENASYFATLILEKKLIYQFMNDHIDLSELVLPISDHILSKVFMKLAINQYKKIGKNRYEIKDGDLKYILWLSNDKIRRVYIDVYDKNNTLIERHWYA